MRELTHNKRPYDVFVSYSHSDTAAVAPLVVWLRKLAGLQVWWDQNRPGDAIASAVSEGISNARAAIFCVSKRWIESSWCANEHGAALQEERKDRKYRVITLRLDDCEIPSFMANSRYLEMRNFEAHVAISLLKSLIPEPALWADGKRDVYLSRSWHTGDSAGLDRIYSTLNNRGFRLVGDSPDYPTFEVSNRVKRIIETCGALVAMLPFRNDPQNSFTSKWIIKELEIAQGLGRRSLIFAAEGVVLSPDLVSTAIGGQVFPLSSCDDDLLNAILLFEEEYSQPPKTAYSFFATSLRNNPQETDDLAELVRQVTCMECYLGQSLQNQHAQQEIVERIRHTEFVLADISDNNLNTLIEAGIARGAGVNLHLICKIPDNGDLQTRFMFRDQEVHWYKDHTERIGKVYMLARRYRRCILLPKNQNR